MDFTSFSHGQIQSKLWLCQNLEPHLQEDSRVAVLGSWYNVLSFIMLSRNEKKCQSILGIDIDPNVKEIADRINQMWTMGPSPRVQHVTEDANTYNLNGFNVVINCSPEHMDSDQWFDNIETGTLVCLQSSDIAIRDDEIWKCVNPNLTLDEFTKKYPLTQYFFSDTLRIQYSDWGYNRFMIIGIK